MAEAQDKVFEQEQAHLSEVYAALERIHEGLVTELEVNQELARQDLIDMSEEIRPDFVGDDEAMETLAAIETLNSVIDAYNQSHDFALDKLRSTLLLLMQPYFAKVQLRMKPGAAPRDIYIGAAGVTDEKHVPIVVDWRSPVAETYYNQESGPTHFMVDGRRRDVELLLRRQFDIRKDVLRNCFDTTVAIEDPLLLSALNAGHSEKLRAITATIQREQNEVVRHEDVPVLLVNGIAGSGKTSVLLQRIAYLFYRQRETLSPEQVRLFTPNDVFARYIDAVLPSLGETNPKTLTWRSFVAEAGLADRADGRATDAARLDALEAAIAGLELDPDDFRDIRAGERVVVRASQVRSAWNANPKIAVGPRRAAAARQALHDKVDRAIERFAKSDELQEEMLALDLDDQILILGEPAQALDEQDVLRLTRIYAQHLFASAHDAVDGSDWLRIDRIGMRILGARELNAAEWLYLDALITGSADHTTRYVMVDEVQDYSPAQLMVLAKHFSAAHFLLLGDEHQAIFEGSAGFDEIFSIFERTHGSVDEIRLLTSYRSSPEITRLFCSLVEDERTQRANSVRAAGTEVERYECLETDAYLERLRTLAADADAAGGLCAFIAESRERVSWLSKQLGDAVKVLGRNDSLPREGVVLLDLALAKGLEFDSVVVVDAQAEVYPDAPLARRRLYTAVSRAMHTAALVSQGPMSPLVG